MPSSVITIILISNIFFLLLFRKMLQDVIQRSSAAAVETPPEEKKEEEKKPEPVVDVKSLSLEERFARSAATSKYVARGGGFGSVSAAPKKSLEEEYPTLGMAVAKSTPAPAPKKYV